MYCRSTKGNTNENPGKMVMTTPVYLSCLDTYYWPKTCIHI